MKFNPAFFSPALTVLFRLWTRSVRYDDQSEWDPILHAFKNGIPAVVALWHNELVAVTGFGYRHGEKYAVVVSESKDGEIIARVLERIGLVTNRGSSSRGGLRALLGMAKEVNKNGRVGVFTVDGPRGPKYEVKEGAIFMAQRAKALLFPVRAFPRKKIVFQKSWDQFEVPYPFTRCRVRVGTPLQVTDEKLTSEVLRKETARLREALLALAPD